MILRDLFIGMSFLVAAGGAVGQTMSPPQRAALNAAERWLERVDKESYADAWTMASENFKATVDRQQWRDGIRKIRKDYGRVVIRKGDRIAYIGNAPNPSEAVAGDKPGMQVAILFDTKFVANKQAIEELQMVLEPDGIWRVSAYHIK